MKASLRRAPLLVVLAVVGAALWLAFVGFVIWDLIGGGVSTGEWFALALLVPATALVLLALLVVAAGAALLRFGMKLAVALKANRLGFCSGLREPGFSSAALTEWLHRTIQTCAGLGQDEPLTFAMLEGEDPERAILLQLITTDLTYARPVRLPLREGPQAEATTAYYFDPNELQRAVPGEVVDAMVEGREPVPLPAVPGRTFYRMPGPDLPVLVAARLSLSFPVLMSTVPLWSMHETEPKLVQHCMSDGGITSNFPIHFFDALVPGRPTFGLDLQRHPQDEQDVPPAAPDVLFGDEPRPPTVSTVDSLFTLFRQILSAARTWRDAVQAELPGYRDRVCQIRLTRTEGGLNLTMQPDVVERLLRRGEHAAERISADFDWDRHRVARHVTLTQVLDRTLEANEPSFDRLVEDLSEELAAALRAADLERDAPRSHPVLRITPDL